MNPTVALRQRTLHLPARLWTGSRWRALLLFATLGLLWFILCRDLSLEWSSNEQYSYGWFVPFFALFLFWLRWEDFGKAEDAQLKSEIGGRKASAFRFGLAACVLLVLLLPIRLFEVANPDWRPLSWMHALTVVAFSLLVIGYWRGWPAVKHFAFPVCFVLVAVPWLTPIEAPIVQGLMRLVASVATEMLTLFGIPAQLEGSLIRVNNGVVGVSEACSGVRSLQTSLMIGLLFGELKRLTIARRFVLVAAALAIALIANFGRAFFLVWIAATQSMAAVERWHDLAGYAIVGAVLLGTVTIASALASKVESEKPNEERDSTAAARRALLCGHFPPTLFQVFTLAFLLLSEASVSAWYRWHESNLVPARPWTVQWPQNAPGFRELPLDEHTREMLRYDQGHEATWIIPSLVRPAPTEPSSASLADRPGRAYLFSFRWEPGTATVLRARAHRPDICLPAVGWKQVGQGTMSRYFISDDLALPFQHLSFVHEEPDRPSLYAETFFCLREDRVRPGAHEAKGSDTIPFSHWSIPERWSAVRHGLRNPGQQVVEVVVLTHYKLGRAEAEETFTKLVTKLVRTES